MTRTVKTVIVIIGLLYGGFIAALVATMNTSVTKIIIVGFISSISVILLMFALDPLQKKLSSKKSKTGKVDTS